MTFSFPTGKIPTRDWLGVRVGRLVVLEPVMGIAGARWRCRCDCGATLVRSASALRKAAERGSASACDACRKVKP